MSQGQRTDLVGPPTYRAMHYRVRATRGKASEHACPCGAQAAEWAYDKLDPDERIGDDHGRPVPYSLDVERYVAKCVSCHRRMDPKTVYVSAWKR
jgi:hypothetical protein